MLIAAAGYTGRYFAKYLHDNKLASQVRLVDKQLPELSWLAPEFKEACSRECFIQADAAQERAYHHEPASVCTCLQTRLTRYSQDLCPKYSTAKAARNSTTSSTVAAKHASPKKRKSTNYAPTVSP